MNSMDDSQTTDDLFTHYLNVCNTALDANKDRFPFKQILEAVEKKQKQRNVEVCIVDNPQKTSFVIYLKDHKINAQRHEGCTNCQCAGTWFVSQSYLKDVTLHPHEYIQNPAKIDWEWMYS